MATGGTAVSRRHFSHTLDKILDCRQVSHQVLRHEEGHIHNGARALRQVNRDLGSEVGTQRVPVGLSEGHRSIRHSRHITMHCHTPLGSL